MHDNELITNTTASRSTGALALCPANSNGGWYFLSLATGDRLLRYSWTECRVTNDILNRVHHLAVHAHVSTQDILEDFDLHISGATLESRSENNTASRSANDANANINNATNEGVNEEADDGDEGNENEVIVDHNNVQDHSDPVITDDEASEASIDADANTTEETNEAHLDEEQMKELFDIDPKSNEEDKERTTSANDNQSTSEVEEDEAAIPITEDPKRSDVNEKEDAVDENNTATSAPKRILRSMKEVLEQEVKRYNLRSKVKKARDDAFNKQHYNYLMFTNKSRSKKRYVQRMKEREFRNLLNVEMSKERRNVRSNRENVHRGLTGLCLTQMSASKGIRVYGAKAVKAMAKEYAQLDELGIFKGRMYGSLKPDERRAVLQVIDLIKEKRCGKIKGEQWLMGEAKEIVMKKLTHHQRHLP